MNTPIPRPGGYLPGPPQTVDPERIHVEVDGLLAGLNHIDVGDGPHRDDPDGHGQIRRQAQILERAHEVLVQALATVDKI